MKNAGDSCSHRRGNPAPQSENELDDLKISIRVAFNAVTCPNDDQLLSPDCCDESELDEFRGRFADATWDQVPVELIDKNYDSLPFFGPAAYRFFLPAYLTRAIDAWPTNARVLQFLIYNLILPKDPVLRHHFLFQKSILDSLQGCCVFNYLRAVRDCHEAFSREADEAIQAYWSKYAR